MLIEAGNDSTENTKGKGIAIRGSGVVEGAFGMSNQKFQLLSNQKPSKMIL